jgi:hypothetical protein
MPRHAYALTPPFAAAADVSPGDARGAQPGVASTCARRHRRHARATLFLPSPPLPPLPLFICPCDALALCHAALRRHYFFDYFHMPPFHAIRRYAMLPPLMPFLHFHFTPAARFHDFDILPC